MVRRFIITISFLLLGVIVLTACSGNEEQQQNNSMENDNRTSAINSIKVYTTLFSLEDLTNHIGGEFVDVTNIIPPGADAHTFEPTVNQMIEIAEGDLFLYNSPNFEGYAETIIDSISSHGVDVLVASKGIEFYHLHDHDHGAEENDDDHNHSHGDEDPHVWLDPIRTISLAENIKNKLVEMLPEEKVTFEKNFIQLRENLRKAIFEFQTMAEESPKNTIVVSHAGYGYWEERYGIQQVAISGLSPSNEPSVKQIQEIITYIKNNDIRYLMFEKNIPSSYVETIKEETDTEILWLHNLETLLPEENNGNEDYFNIMMKNVETLRKALQ